MKPTGESKKRRGFTLIELLVVVGIMVILAAIGVVSYRSANIRARDGRRQADLEQVRVALELYRSDNPGYPSPASGYDGLGADLVPDYINAMPVDPKDGWEYRWIGNDCFDYGGLGVWYCTTYELCAELEGSNPGTCSNPGSDYCSPGAGEGGANCNYGAKSP